MLRTAAIAGEAGNIRASTITMTDGKNANNDLMTAIDEYNNFIVDASSAAAAAASEQASFAKTLLVAIVLGSLLVAIAAATWIAIAISRGLSSAVGLANAVAVGDLSQTVAVRSQDEIGDLVT